MTMRPFTRWTSWIVGLCLATSLVGCSSDGASTPTLERKASGPQVLDVASDLNREQLEELGERFSRWGGDLETAQAAAVIVAHGVNGERDECLQAAGVPFEAWAGWEATIGSATVPQWYDGSPVTVLPVRYWSYPIKVNAGAERLRKKQSKKPPKKYRAAFAQCAALEDRGPDSTSTARLTPTVVVQLREKWLKALGQDVHARPLDKVVPCLEAATLPPPFDGPPGLAAQDWFTTFATYLPEGDEVPVGNERPTPRWQAYLDAEEALAGALWECQGDGDRLLAEAVAVAQQFDKAHEDEIERAERGWERLRDRATKLGWAPRRPFAGLPKSELK